MHAHSGFECIRAQSEKPVERDDKPDAGRQMTDDGLEKTTEDRSRFA